MKATIRISKETAIKNIQTVKEAIAEIKNKENFDAVIETLAQINGIHAISSCTCNRIHYKYNFMKPVGNMNIVVSVNHWGAVEIKAAWIVKGIIDGGKSTICELINYAIWEDGWLKFTDQHENGGAKSVFALGMYFEQR